MKKKSKIRILKDNQNDDSYTFVIDLDLSSNHDLQGTLKTVKNQRKLQELQL